MTPEPKGYIIQTASSVYMHVSGNNSSDGVCVSLAFCGARELSTRPARRHSARARKWQWRIRNTYRWQGRARGHYFFFSSPIIHFPRRRHHHCSRLCDRRLYVYRERESVALGLPATHKRREEINFPARHRRISHCSRRHLAGRLKGSRRNERSWRKRAPTDLWRNCKDT